MTHSCFNILPIPLLAAALLFLFFVGPVVIHAEDKSSESVEVVTQETSPIMALFQRWQTNEPEDNRREQYYFIKRPKMGAQLTYEFNNESQTLDGATIEDSSHKFIEKISAETSGWIYHPGLMQYSLMIEPELTQVKEELSQGETAETNSFSPDYAMTATFLETKPYTLNVFTNHQQELSWATFTGNSESSVDSYGANVQLKDKTLPTTLGYSHSETDQIGFYASKNIHEDFNLSSAHQTQRSNTSLISSYSDDQSSSEGFETQIKTLNNSLFNNYHLTEDKKVQLNSTLTYRNQETSWLDTQNIDLREHLNWRHRPNLQSNYSVSHNRMESGDSNSDITNFEAGLTHLLYENLTTDVGSRAHQYNYSGGKENSANGYLDFSYSRPLSWAKLGLSSGWDYLYTDRSGFTTTVALVTDETHRLSLSEEVYLNNYNIDLATIIVTNNSGTIVYIENIDYRIQTINDYVRISRLPFGSITDGQTVSVNYRYLRNSEYDDTLLTENYGFNFDLLRDWSFSYNFLRVTQNIISGQPPLHLVDDTVHRADVRYDINWSNTSLSYEDNNRQSSPAYTRREIQETLYYRSQLQFYVSLNGYFGQTDYKDHDETKEFYGGVTTFDWMLSRWCKLRVEGFYDKTQGNFENTENTGMKTSLEFRYRIWTARLSYELTDQNYILTDYQRTEQLARFEIIRIMW